MNWIRTKMQDGRLAKHFYCIRIVRIREQRVLFAVFEERGYVMHGVAGPCKFTYDDEPRD